MPVNPKINITRSQLAAFIKDPDTLKQFEKLIQNMNTLVPATNTVIAVETRTTETRTSKKYLRLKENTNTAKS